MASKMGYYNVEDFMKQKRQQEKDIKVPPKANFLAAADHIRKLFEGKKFTYGIMGGLEMLCLGYRREMPDLQIAYDDKDFHKIKSKLEHDQRVRLPEGMNSLFPAKILVRTGPAYKDEGCTQSGDIEVDLVPPGSHGTPPNGSLASNIVLLSLKNEGKLKSYKGLNMSYLLKSLVHYCRVRDLAWDPRKDIVFLCQHYAAEVQSVRTQLDQKAVQQNFLGTPFLSRLSLEDQRRCYQVLLGTQPPPVMAITPPPPLPSHKHSASDSDASAKPRLSSHQSSPSLNAPGTSALLSPPLPGKPRAPRQHTIDGSTQISELPAPQKAHQPPVELSTAPRESRSRYRQVHTPGSREISPVEIQGSAPNVVHTMQRSQPPLMDGHRLATHGMQQGRINRLQPPPQIGTVGMATQDLRSMQNTNVGSSGIVPPYAFAQTPSLNRPEMAPQLKNHRIPVEMSTTPTYVNTGQQFVKLPLGLRGAPLDKQGQISNNLVTHHAVPPQAWTVHPTKQQAQTHLAGISTEPRRIHQFHVVNPDEPEQNSLRSDSVIGIPSGQKPSLPAELDAVSQLGQFIAELSADRSTPTPSQATKHESYDISIIDAYQTQSPNAPRPRPSLVDSPVSPEDLDITPTASHGHNQVLPIRPLKPRTYSAPAVAPAAALPPSLTAGGLTPHKRFPSHTSNTSTTQNSVTNTNASKYTRYYSAQTPPSSTPNSPQPTYRAYQPSSASPPLPTIPLSPPSISPETPSERYSRFTALRDVDGAHEYFKHHKRDASHDSHASSRSGTSDSRELAMEYQAELPRFDEGYGS